MKRNAKSRGSGGRLRLGLLAATAAAFLLVPVAAASAAEVHILGGGTGSGWVMGQAPLNGTPPIECHIVAGVPSGPVCDATANTNEGITGELVKEEADSGSVFVEWEVTEEPGVAPIGCETVTASECGVATFAGFPIKIKATFNPEPGIPLGLTTSGSGSGSFECDTGSGAEACKAEYPAGTEVEVIPVDGVGSDFVEFNAENGGECSGASCEVTMSGPRSVNAKFDLESVPFSTTVIGEGTVQCDSGGGPGACAASYTYGDEIEVVATPNSIEYVLASIAGTGSASGCTESGCEFTITAPSSVTAEFKTAAFKDEAKVETVHGEVPETTTLESACSDVDLGKFLPGVTDDYTNTCGLTLTSTGAATALTAEDESETHTGHLVKGSYFLPSVLKASATDSEAKGTSTGLVPLNESVPGAATLLTFGVPIAKDAATLEFSQHIDEHDGLNTGVYAKTITLTLEQTSP